MKKTNALLLCVLLLVGCSNELDTPNQQQEETSKAETMTIPLEEALGNLENVLSEINTKCQKQGLPPRSLMDKHECIVLGLSLNRESGQYRLQKSSRTQQVDTTLYIVNFASNKGYAVLSANRRMPDDVLLVTDYGYLSAEDLMREDDYSNLEIDTLNPYCAEDDDYYVGFTIDDNSNKRDRKFTQTLVMNYHNKYVEDQKHQQPTTYYTYSQWQHHSSVAPLVHVKWRQSDPFNRLSPKRCGKKAPAGCVAIAVAQILSANKNVTTLNGVTINWSSMNRYPQPIGDDQDKIAIWVRYIAKKCCMVYGCTSEGGYGMATPEGAKNFLKKLSPYKSVKKLKTYNGQTAIDMVKAGKPVFISAFHAPFAAHAWVIDGYLKQQRTRTEKYIGTNNVISTATEYRELIHCNYGWEGIADGYYASGIFDTSAGPVEIDPIDGYKYTSNNGQYYYLYRMIVYDF